MTVKPRALKPGDRIGVAAPASAPYDPARYENGLEGLRTLGFDVQWHRYPMQHAVCAEEIRDLGDWMAAFSAWVVRFADRD